MAAKIAMITKIQRGHAFASFESFRLREMLRRTRRSLGRGGREHPEEFVNVDSLLTW